MRKLFSSTLAAILMLLLLSGCTSAQQTTVTNTNDSPAPVVSVSSERFAYPETDRAGNAITRPKNLDAIVSLAPASTQTLIHLGLADKLVAIDTNSAVLEGVPQGLPQVDLLNPDGEVLLDLSPDLVVASDMTSFEGSTPLRILKENDAVIALIPSSNSIKDIKLDIMFIADITDKHDKGVTIITEFEAAIDEIASKTADVKKRSVYFEIAAAPSAYSFGNHTFLNEMIGIAGGENIFADMDSWLAVNEELVVARNPDVIFTNVTYIEDPIGEIKSRESLKDTSAVINDEVYIIDEYASSSPNEYIITALRQMAQALHPNLWEN